MTLDFAKIAESLMNIYHLSNRHDGVLVRAYALQSVERSFISLVESHQKTSKNGIHRFPAWRSAQKRQYRENAGKLACCGPRQDA